MVVTCPKCSKRYMLDEALLPQEGRQVRCISCHHIWRKIPDLSNRPTTPPFVGAADIALQMKVSSEQQSSWMQWIIIASILVAFASTLILGRNLIVAYWPRAEKYYELVGLQVSLPGSGLSITNASSQIYQEGPIEMIRVMGSVVNASGSSRPIPPLKIKLMGNVTEHQCVEQNNGEGCVLDHWEHRLSEQSLLPGEKIQFETDPRPRIPGTQHIRVEF